MKHWTCEVCRLAHGAEYDLPGDVRANLCPTCYHGFLRIFARAARPRFDIDAPWRRDSAKVQSDGRQA